MISGRDSGPVDGHFKLLMKDPEVVGETSGACDSGADSNSQKGRKGLRRRCQFEAPGAEESSRILSAQEFMNS